MGIVFYLSILLNAVLIIMLSMLTFKMRQLSWNLPQRQKSEPEEEQPAASPPPVRNKRLHDLALACEAKLPAERRNMAKILVETDEPDLPALLQIGELKISLKRDGKNRSLYEVDSAAAALHIARYGHPGTGRYIPVPAEVEFVLAHLDIINTYLEALGLEVFFAQSKFWTVNTQTGYSTGWKRFNWDIKTALEKLQDKFQIRQSDGTYQTPPPNQPAKAKLFVLLKGWEHLFAEA